jgi:N,N'-diacetylbacillosaminyl-diphospho-undecaprenol alpha-1,3-N-acetylgalactosaminyltransferase
MKIAFLSHLDLNLYLFRLPIMQTLVKSGHTVYAVCPKGDKFDLFEGHGIQAIAYSIDRGSLNPFKEVKSIYNIYKALKPLNIDILHTFTAKPNIYGTIAGKCVKVPTIINLVEGLGSFYVDESLKNTIMQKVIETCYRGVFLLSDQVVFVNSDDPKYLLSKNVIKEKKVTIIRSVGIDTQVYNPDTVSREEITKLKQELQIENKLVVLMVARAIWHKGVREYYEAANTFSENENIQFIFVGDIDQGNPSSADEHFLNSSNVRWLGHRDDIALLTALCDIYVLPSYYREGLPRTLMEASSMGRPIVTTNTVGCREVVKDGYNGYLVPIKNSAALAEKISILSKDEKLREVMGKHGRILAIDAFDVQKVIGQYVALYDSAMKERK